MDLIKILLLKHQKKYWRGKINSMRLIYFLLFASSGLLAQGSLGFQFGLNDDNFGSIENIGNKIDNYDLDIKNSTGFQFGFFTEIDLITFYIRPELNLIFSKSKNAAAYSLDQGVNIAEHSYKSSEIQLPIIFGYKLIGPISIFGGPSFKYNLSNSSNFNLEDIKDKYTLSLLLGSRVKIRSISIGLRYERGLNNKEVLIINANGVDLDNANVDLTTNKLSLNISFDIPYGLFKKKD